MTEKIPYAVSCSMKQVENLARGGEGPRASYLAVHMIANVVDYVDTADIDAALAARLTALLGDRATARRRANR